MSILLGQKDHFKQRSLYWMGRLPLGSVWRDEPGWQVAFHKQAWGTKPLNKPTAPYPEKKEKLSSPVALTMVFQLQTLIAAPDQLLAVPVQSLSRDFF